MCADQGSKKVPATDAIFANLQHLHADAAQDAQDAPHCHRHQSQGEDRRLLTRRRGTGAQAVQAADHDIASRRGTRPRRCILEVQSNQLSVIFGTSRDTSDFLADSLELWWADRQAVYPGVRRLLIDLDNGPEIASSRTQFMNAWSRSPTGSS